MEQEIKNVADSIREKHYGDKGKSEKDRLKDILSVRDKAIKLIEDYQDKTGIPTDGEVDGQFLDNTNSGMSVDEFNETENQDTEEN